MNGIQASDIIQVNWLTVPLKPSQRTVWAKSVLQKISKGIVGNANIQIERHKDQQNITAFMGGIPNLDRFKYLTHTYGQPFPAELQNVAIILPKIKTLMGEMKDRPSHPSVRTINPDAVVRKTEKRNQLLFYRELKPVLDEQRQNGVPHPDPVLPENIEAWMDSKYREPEEKLAQDSLDYIYASKRIKEKLLRGFEYGNLTGKQHAKVEIVNGDPDITIIDPRDFICDFTDNDPYLENSMWAGQKRWMSISEIWEKYGDYLDNEAKQLLMKIPNMNRLYSSDMNLTNQWFNPNLNGTPHLLVIDLEWRAYANLAYVEKPASFDENFLFTKILGEEELEKITSKKNKAKSLGKKEYEEIWEGVNIGNVIFTKLRPRPNQPREEENPYKARLSYFTVLHNYYDGKTVGVADLLFHIQETINILIYHIKRLLAAAGGKAVVYDTSQLPPGYDVNRVAYHIKSDGLILINSKQEGNQVGGSSGFNQFQQIDFTLSASLQQYINLYALFDGIADSITGINKGRMGNPTQEGLGLNQEMLRRAAAVTELMFYNHLQWEQRIYQELIDLSKIAWADGKRATFFMGNIQKIVDLTGNNLQKYMAETYGVMVEDSMDALRKLQDVRMAAAQALQTGNVSFAEYFETQTSENVIDMKRVILSGAMKREKQLQENERAQMEMQNRDSMLQAQLKDREIKVKEEKNANDIAIARMNNETKRLLMAVGKRMDQDMERTRLANQSEMLGSQQAHESRMEDKRFYQQNVMAPVLNQQIQNSEQPVK